MGREGWEERDGEFGKCVWVENGGDGIAKI